MPDPRILVLGAGSVGRRHLRNLAAEGCRVATMDPREDRLDEAASEVDLQARFTRLEDALAGEGAYDGIVIASPPKFHVEQSIAALERGIPVLLEKPVSPDVDSSRRLLQVQQATGTPLLLGYTYRWWPPLREARRLLEEGAVGKLLHVRCVMSAHLADWHPWERYQDFFMASRELGGGALLDESHFIDLMFWMFGMPSEVFARVERLSDLEIDTDDNVDALLHYPSGARVMVHLDLFGRPHEKHITFTGQEGTLVWSFDPNRIRLSRSAAGEWEDRDFGYERNDMFVEVVREFLRVIASGEAPSCTAEDGYQVMRILDAMRTSSAGGRTVALG